MNKKTIIASLNKIANELDNNGLYKEANEITNVMMKVSQAQSGVIQDWAPGGGGSYKDLSIPEQRGQIDKILVKARELSNKSLQFQTPAPGKYKSKSMGWDYIKDQEKRLDPEVYNDLFNEWKNIAQEIAGRKETKKPYKYTDPTGDDALNYYVNQAMAQHNVDKTGWTTLKTLIMGDKDITDKKGAYLKASNKFQKAINSLGSVNENFKEDSSLQTRIPNKDNRLPYPAIARKPGETFPGPKSSIK
jgi:hypothetical protein